jgi:hypothetical protein
MHTANAIQRLPVGIAAMAPSTALTHTHAPMDMSKLPLPNTNTAPVATRAVTMT